MKPFRHPHIHKANSLCVNRPVHRPTDTEYHRELVRDLSRQWWGMDARKAAGIAWVPLMDVALDGMAGMDVAQARSWSQAA